MYYVCLQYALREKSGDDSTVEYWESSKFPEARAWRKLRDKIDIEWKPESSYKFWSLLVYLMDKRHVTEERLWAMRPEEVFTKLKQAEATGEPPQSAAPIEKPADPQDAEIPVDPEKSKAEKYAALLKAVHVTTDSFKGKYRRVTVLLILAGGRKCIKDVATDEEVGWDHPYKTGVDGYLKLVRPKLKKCRAFVQQIDQELRIIHLSEAQKSPRRRTTKVVSKKKAAPPKRRQ